MNRFPGEVSMDFRFTVPPAETPDLLELLSALCALMDWNIDNVHPDALPWEHTLPMFEGL